MKIFINKKDYKRVILTDTLPYEVPMLFSNDHFYELINDKNLPKEIKSYWLDGKIKSSIPYQYKIKKGSGAFRTLSIIHPIIQIQLSDFYKQYEHLMIYMCSKSPASLRAPHKVGGHYYEKDFLKNRVSLKEGSVDIIYDGFDLQSQTASSFFSYKKYPFVYKFYESYEFHRLERKYEKLLKLDISKCFSHIYTHSISWAVKSKEYAKGHTGDEHFEGKFDKLFMKSNHNETNGILIGPEVSRIYAEIILQQVDVNVIKKLRSVFGFNYGAEYVIKRYVDDYFIFSSDDNVLQKIELILSDELELYKLYLNESKKEILSRPFITNVTIAKYELKLLIDDLYSKLLDENSLDFLNGVLKGDVMLDDIHMISESLPIKERSKVKSNDIIKALKLIVKTNNVSFDVVSSYLLTAIKKKLFHTLKYLNVVPLPDEKLRVVWKFLSVQLEVIFFIYSMDNRVRPTYIICQIILELNVFSEKHSMEFKEVLKKNILDEVVLSIRSLKGFTDGGYVEFSNLLICMKALGDEYSLGQDYLIDFVQIEKKKNKNPSYFLLCSLLYYIQDRNDYNELKTLIISIIEDKMQIGSQSNIKSDCEISLMVMDIITCPSLDLSFKVNIFRIFFEGAVKNKKPAHEIEEVINYLNGKCFFFNWNGHKNLEQILYKKELRSPYE